MNNIALRLNKPRADARLKTLPELRQAEIAQFALTHTLAQTVLWLGQSGLTTSISAVSKFLRWHRYRQQLADSEAALGGALADVIRQDSALGGERLRHLGHLFFAATALQNQDARAWHVVQQDALRHASLELRTQKSYTLNNTLVPSCTLLYPSRLSPVNPSLQPNRSKSQ